MADLKKQSWRNEDSWSQAVEDLEDYESEDLEDDVAVSGDDAALRGRNSYLGGLWDKYGFTSAVTDVDKTNALVTAHKMVQQFVNTFAGAEAYRVTFDPGFTTAGTDLVGRKIAISPAPVFDATLTPQEAGLILTAMATHEASHPRYGRSTAAAVWRVFGKKRAPNTLSNLLDDVRIERRFAAEYPGYADVFRPMLDYVGRLQNKTGREVTPSFEDMVNLAILAVRYADSTKFDSEQLKAERAWWQAWAERWAKEDAPRRHVEGVREGLKRIAMQKARLRAIRERAMRAGGGRPVPFVPPPSAPPPPSALALADAMKKLSPIQQKAMRMVGQGRKGPEIAATLGLSIADTRTLVRNARTQIALATRTTGTAGSVSGMSSMASSAWDALRRGRQGL